MVDPRYGGPWLWLTLAMVDPHYGGPSLWWTLAMVDPRYGGPWLWWTLAMVDPHHGWLIRTDRWTGQVKKIMTLPILWAAGDIKISQIPLRLL